MPTNPFGGIQPFTPTKVCPAKPSTRQIPCLPQTSTCTRLIVIHPLCRSPKIPRALADLLLPVTGSRIFAAWESSDTAYSQLTTFPAPSWILGKSTQPLALRRFLKSTVLASQRTGVLRCKGFRNSVFPLQPAKSYETLLCKSEQIVNVPPE